MLVLQHLVQWDAGDPECLLQLVKELIQQYHSYQCQRLRESSRLLFEYDSLLEWPFSYKVTFSIMDQSDPSLSKPQHITETRRQKR